MKKHTFILALAFSLTTPLHAMELDKKDPAYALLQLKLGGDYEEKQEYAKALECYKLAALEGNVDAQITVGHWYHKGIGVKENKDEADKYLSMAAEKGDLRAFNMLGMIYIGLGNATKVYWTFAAEKGYVVSQYNLGWAYEKGFWEQPNNQEALKWYEKAAAQGYEQAKEKIKKIKEKMLENRRFEVFSYAENGFNNLIIPEEMLPPFGEDK